MTTSILRATRCLVAMIVSAHVLLLRLHTTFADKKAAKAHAKVVQAQNGLEFARQALTYARLSVREFKDAKSEAEQSARNTRIAADAECKFYGRSL